MSIQRNILVFSLSGLMATSVAAFDMKPGEWEMETKMDAMPAGLVLPKTKICVTPKQTEWAKGGKMGDMPKGCSVKIIENKSDLVSHEIVCDEQGMKTESKGTVKKISDNEVVTTIVTTVSQDGQKQTQQMVTRQTYIGPTCSKEAR
jgi:hypothetical protein